MKNILLHTGLLSALLLALGLGLPHDAHACWDGLRADSGSGVVVMFPYGGGEGPNPEPLPEWELAQARDYAVLLGRVAHLAGAGSFVSLAPWEIEVCTDDGARHCVRQEAPAWGSTDAILAEVGALVGASAADLRAAQRLVVPVWTVEVLAAASPAEADAVAARINALSLDGLSGNVEIGGFPAINPVAHRVAVAGGQARVVVGTFLHEAEARQAAASLRDAAGVEGAVRPLAMGR